MLDILLQITPLALADAVNPCAIAVLTMVLVSIIINDPSDKKKILSAGFAFILAVSLAFVFLREDPYEIEELNGQQVKDGGLEYYSVTLLDIQGDSISAIVSTQDHELFNETINLRLTPDTKFIFVGHNLASGEIEEKFISLDDLVLGDNLFIYATPDNTLSLIEKAGSVK